jgi:hypothetical protein
MNNELIEQVARAIYRTHWRAPTPVWENASEDVRNWVRKQAQSAIEAMQHEEVR